MKMMKELKNAIRKEVSKRISTISSEEKSRQSFVVIGKLFRLPVFEKSQRISVYLSTESEINTKPILEEIFKNNKQCFIPRYDKKNMEMVKLNSIEDYDNLPLTSWKIKQPSLSENRENALETGGLDLIIVPGVAFTPDGKRMGHGGGYYDKYLKTVKKIQGKQPVTISLAFKEQIRGELPCEEHDESVDIILYDK